jgi:hypothetical protein
MPQGKSLEELLVGPAHQSNDLGLLLMRAVSEKTSFVR